MRHLFPFVHVLLILASALQLVASVDVEILGKQKARIFKAIKYDFLQKTNNRFGNAAGKQAHVIHAFEKDQQKLLASTQDPDEQKMLQTISEHWGKLKHFFDTPVTDATIESVFKKEFHEGLMTKKLVLKLTQKQLKSAHNKELFYINNLRAISQKFAITYLVKTVEPQGATSETTQKELAITLEKFRTALDHLHATLKEDSEKALLEELEKTYIYFDFLSKSKRFTPTLIIHKSDKMLTIAMELIQHYHAREQAGTSAKG